MPCRKIRPLLRGVLRACVLDHRQIHPAYGAVLLAAGLLVFGLLFQQLVTLLVAVLVTILVAIPLSAAATRLERRGVPRAVGALVALLSGFVVLVGLVALLVPPLVDQAEQLVEDIPSIVDELSTKIGHLAGSSPEQTGESLQNFFERYTDDPARLLAPLASVGLDVAGVLAILLVIVLTAYYMAVSPRPLLDGALSLVKPARRDATRQAMDRLRTAWIGWMQGVLIDMVITGVLLYVALLVIGLDFAIFFATLSALLVVIPYFGAIAGAIPPVLYALSYSPGKALLVLGVYVLIQQLESNVTIPLVMAQRVKLHPAMVAIGVVIVGQLFGFVGLFVAVPILSLIMVLVDELWARPLDDREGIQEADSLTVALAEPD